MFKIPLIKSFGITGIRGVSGADHKKATVPLSECEDKFQTKNLLHFLKKKIRSVEEVANFINDLPDEERYIGSLPDSWRDKFPEKKLKDKTLKIEKLFSSFAKSAYTPADTELDTLQHQTLILSVFLTLALGEKCVISPSGKGQFGKVFRVQTKNEDLALKIFHSDPKEFMLLSHGQTKEIANAVALSHTLKPDKCTRFYCGKVTLPGEDDAFILTKYIEKNDEKQTGPADEWTYKRIYHGDSKQAGNVINGMIVDFGAIEYSFENPAQQDFAKQMYPLLKKGDFDALKTLRENNEENSDFIKAREILTKPFQKNADNITVFAISIMTEKYTKEQIQAMREAGVDFSALESYDFEGVPTQLTDKLKEYGFKIKC